MKQTTYQDEEHCKDGIIPTNYNLRQKKRHEKGETCHEDCWDFGCFFSIHYSKKVKTIPDKIPYGKYSKIVGMNLFLSAGNFCAAYRLVRWWL